MIRFTVTVLTSGGLHARPASVLVHKLGRYAAAVTIFHHEKQANGKSILSIMALGAKTGEEIAFEVEGADEEQAAQCIRDLFAQNFGG